MGKTGTRVKFNTLKQQRQAAELELIIEEFGQAMRRACRQYISRPLAWGDHLSSRFTPHMDNVFYKYIKFCQEHPE